MGRQTKNDLTGEHTMIMLKVLEEPAGPSSSWLGLFWADFRRRLVSLLGYNLSSLSPSLALSLLHNKAVEVPATTLSPSLLTAHLTPYDVKRLELYSNNMADHHLITDLLPAIARLVLTKQLGNLHLSAVQQAILAGLGLQHKSVDTLAEELELPASQLLALFNRSVRKVVGVLREILEGGVVKQAVGLPSLGVELTEAAEELEKKQKKEAKQLFVNKNLSEYVIKGTDSEWGAALEGSKAKVVSVKTGEKRPLETDSSLEAKTKENREPDKKKKHKKKAKASS